MQGTHLLTRSAHSLKDDGQKGRITIRRFVCGQPPRSGSAIAQVTRSGPTLDTAHKYLLQTRQPSASKVTHHRRPCRPLHCPSAPCSHGQTKSDCVFAIPDICNMSWFHAIRLPSRIAPSPVRRLTWPPFADIFLLGRDEHAGICHVVSNRQESDCRYATMDTWLYLYE